MLITGIPVTVRDRSIHLAQSTSQIRHTYVYVTALANHVTFPRYFEHVHDDSELLACTGTYSICNTHTRTHKRRKPRRGYTCTRCCK